MSTFSIPELAVPFFFRDRPAAVPGDLRPEWRIAVLLLLLRKCCRENRSSFGRLHVLNWAARSEDGHSELLEIIAGAADPDTITVRIEPALNRAVEYARGENLVEIVRGDRVQLSERGVSLADDIAGTGEIFLSEKRFIAAIGRRLTEDTVNRILKPSGGF